MSNADALCERRGILGLITINRADAMNALTLEAAQIMLEQLILWREDPKVEQVLVRGAGDRGLCAGGDIRSIYEDMRAVAAGERATYATEEFFRTEYQTNLLINDYPKPYIAFMDGVTLGGGVGISAHGSHRVVTERSKVGMPETTLGFIPDVGGTYLLNRSPGATGMHAALTAGIFGPMDSIHLNLADVLVPSDQLDQLAAELEHTPVDTALPEFATSPENLDIETSQLARNQEWIDESYGADTVEEILERLGKAASQHSEAGRTKEIIEQKSPTALKVTHAALRRAEKSDLAGALRNEESAAHRMLRGREFTEGIRAQIIDKDKRPQWTPSRLDEVNSAEIDAHFVPPKDQHVVPSASLAGGLTSGKGNS